MEHNILAGVVDAALSAGGRLKQWTENGQAALSALLAQAGATIEEKVGGFLTPPDSPGSYIRIGPRLISKQMLLLILIAVLGAAALFSGTVYPWMDGRLWPSRLTLGSEKAASFTGRVELFTAGGSLAYEGSFMDGLPSGAGTQYDREGQLIYRGAFQAGRYEGEGRLYECGVLRYAGGFHENSFSGEGTQYDDQGRLLYRGSFAEGLWAGTGVEFAPETGKKVYTGAFAEGRREGHGTEYAPDGEVLIYSGAFVRGVYSGEGRLYRDGALWYSGSFAEGLFSGPGTSYDTITGHVLYEGGFLAGRYDGEGRLYDTLTGKLVYSGGFSAGLRCGEGTEYDDLGRAVFTGSFRDGMIDLMRYLGEDVTDFQVDFGAESARKTVGGIQVLFYSNQNLAIVCRPGAEGVRCWKIVSGLSVELAGISRGAEASQVRAVLGEPFTALELELSEYYGLVFTGLGTAFAEGMPVLGEKYLRGGYFVRVYYSLEGKAMAAELCAIGGY